jgi:RND family efflux transporter MFP subunit
MESRLMKFSWLRASLVLAMPLGAAGCEAPVAAAASPGSIPVRVALVGESPEHVPLRYPGIVRAAQRSVVAPQVSGLLIVRDVELGDEVTAGQRLARLRNPQLDPRRSAALAEIDALLPRVARAEREVVRFEGLRKDSLVAQQLLDDARSELQAVQASLERARAEAAAAGDTAAEQAIHAPHAGVVAGVYVEPGEFLPAGQPLLALLEPTRLEVLLRLPPQTAVALAADGPVRVHTRNGATIPARIARNPRAALPPSGLVEVTLALEAHGVVVAGDYVEASLAQSAAGQVTIPARALRSEPGTDQVSVLALVDDRVHYVPVVAGMILGDTAWVSGALAIGTPIVVEAATTLRSGDRVRRVQ